MAADDSPEKRVGQDTSRNADTQTPSGKQDGATQPPSSINSSQTTTAPDAKDRQFQHDGPNPDLLEKVSTQQSRGQQHELETGPSAASSTKPPISLIREILFVTVVCSSNIFTQGGLGMTIIPIRAIGNGLGITDPGGLSWFVAAYSLTVGTFILIAGRLGDIFGHKLLLVSGFFWYGFWSLIAGITTYAHSQIFFDVCRALQGIGPAMMVPNALAILGSTYPPGRRKEMVFSIFGATAPNGFIIGGVFGAILARFAWWPWEFWVLAIACGAFGVLAILVIPGPFRGGDRSNKKFDYLGSVSGVAGLVLFNVAWNQAPIVGWNDPSVIVLLIVGIAIVIFFLWVERKTPQALVPPGALSGKVGFVLGCIALSWSSFGIWVYYFFQITQNLRHVSPLLSVAQVTPAGVSGCLAALTTGFLLSRVRTSYLMAISMLAFCTGNILIATMPISQTYWIQTFLATVITPWGMDISFPAATIILSNFVPKEHQGIAGSLVTTVVNYSISIGLGIGGTVESHVNRQGQDMLRGYRGALYAGIGLSGMGFLFATVFIWSEAKFLRSQR